MVNSSYRWALSISCVLGCAAGAEQKLVVGADAAEAAPERQGNVAPSAEPGASNGATHSGDDDGDGVVDTQDNCVGFANPDQLDRDGDGDGDLCDNCPIVANSTQESVVCKSGVIGEDDSDGDGSLDLEDNCALLANFDQTNSDGDLFGDACDNCPSVSNDTQGNVDGDLYGDACDDDLSNEQVCAAGSTRAEPLKPNLYFVFDTSGSMADEDLSNLGAAVTAAARGTDDIEGTGDDLVNHFNVGVGTYPTQTAYGSVACRLEPQEVLPLRKTNRASELISVVPDSGEGGTPTAAALKGAFDRQLFVLDGELPSSRPAAIVLMTDGSPNDCGGQSGTVAQAARFASIGVPVYLIAYNIGGDALRQATEVAYAGSVDQSDLKAPIEASDAAGIAAAFNAIRTQIASCTFPFTAGPNANFDRPDVVLHVAGRSTELSEGDNGYLLDLASGTVSLTGNACEEFKQHVEGDTSVELRVACKAKCEPMTELCDFRDNDCDGSVDEGCSTQPPEVCNGVDDDGDGKVDEGCPTVIL